MRRLMCSTPLLNGAEQCVVLDSVRQERRVNNSNRQQNNVRGNHNAEC